MKYATKAKPERVSLNFASFSATRVSLNHAEPSTLDEIVESRAQTMYTLRVLQNEGKFFLLGLIAGALGVGFLWAVTHG